MNTLFQNQDKLPKLPVPPLQKTLTKYAQTLVPFISTIGPDGKPHVNEKEYQRIQAIIKDFGTTLGPKLQDRLQHYAAAQPNNWLEDWWLRFAYHSWREPLLINSNWFTVFEDHPNTPKDLLHPKLSMVAEGHITPFQIHRSAGLITNALNMKEAIERGSIPAETMGSKKIPLCMEQYRLMFGWTRIPLPNCDKNVNPGGFPSTSKHIIAMLRDQIYVVPVYDSTGVRLSIADLERQLWQVVNDVWNTPLQPSICILTADQRDNWATARAYLVDYCPKNKEALGWIESSLFVFCLDDYSLPDTYDQSFQNMAYAMDGHNRWYDKAISIICMSHGRAGLNGEHSPCDALIPSRLMDWLVENEPAMDPAGAKPFSANRSAPIKLTWNVDDTIRGFIRKAEATAAALIKDCDAGVLIFKGHGSEFVKQNAKISADAYVQMALQLAFYRMHGKWCATYETASTRQFKHGRTETIRTCSKDSINFVTTFARPGATIQEKYQALIAAGKAHSQYTLEAMQGYGVDRHLFGLKLSLKEGESHPIFTDPVMRGSTWFRLSTSGLSSGELYRGTGFGCAVPDGYGTNYCIGKNAIKFGLESKKTCRETSTIGFKHALLSAFHDMKTTCEQANSSKI